jgi:hypothetical protein
MTEIIRSGCAASASFTPAAAAYSAADIMSVAQEFRFSDPALAHSRIRILTSTLMIDATALQASEAAYSLALYGKTPPSAQADNAAWDVSSADLPFYRGTLSLGTPVDLGSTLYIKTGAQDFDVTLGATASLWGVLITAAGFTATAVARQVGLIGIVL